MNAVRPLLSLPLLVTLALLGPGCAAEAQATAADEANIEEARDGVFSSNADFSFKLEAPVSRLFRRFDRKKFDPLPPGHSETSDAEFMKDPDYSEMGKLIVGGKSLDVQVFLRGNSSRNECTFLKYKIEFTDKDQTVGTPFQGVKKFRVNSHCGEGKPTDHGDHFGRVMNEVSPVREELAYRMIRAAGVETYRTRLSRISYRDTTPTDPLAPMDRYGLVVESGDTAADRFIAAGKISKDSEYMNSDTGDPTTEGADVKLMREQDLAEIELVEALLGNWDWTVDGLKNGGFPHTRKIWNVDVFGVAHEATQLPIPQDFDLSLVVLANDKASDVLPRVMQPFRRLHAESSPARRAAIKRFLDHKDAIAREMSAVEETDIARKAIPSEDGKTSTDPGFFRAHRLFDAFFAMPEMTP